MRAWKGLHSANYYYREVLYKNIYYMKNQWDEKNDKNRTHLMKFCIVFKINKLLDARKKCSPLFFNTVLITWLYTLPKNEISSTILLPFTVWKEPNCPIHLYQLFCITTWKRKLSVTVMQNSWCKWIGQLGSFCTMLVVKL